MYMNEQTQEFCRTLVQKTFQLNAFLDNCAYNLDDMGYEKTQKAFHERFAHQPPAWADTITELVSTHGVRMTRLGLEDETVKYDTLYDVFSSVLKNFIIYRNSVKNVIEVAEINEDIAIKIGLEEYLSSLNVWFKQVQIWEKRAEEFTGTEFDVHFLDFFIDEV